MDEMITRPALPMKFDVKTEPALFVSAYTHLGKPKIIINWIMIALSVIMAAAAFFLMSYSHSRSARSIVIAGILLIVYCLFLQYAILKRFETIGQAQAKLCGDSLHYEITEEGVTSSAQDGYSFRPFVNFFKATVYPDMWFLYFGDKNAPTIIFLFKSAFPDPADQAAIEALLKEKLAGRPMIYKK